MDPFYDFGDSIVLFVDTLKLSRYNRLNKRMCRYEKYNAEFKSTIVELYQTGRTVRDLSREYGVSEITIYKWGPWLF